MITILPETTKDPISLIGRRAGICWGADIKLTPMPKCYICFDKGELL